VANVTPEEMPSSLAAQIAKSFTSLHRRIDEIEIQLRNYKAVADISPIPVALISKDDHTNVYANPAYAKMVECDVVELLGDSWTHFHHPEDLAPLLAAWRTFLSSPEAAFRCASVQ
jgi:PAS domain-containing protein